MSPWGVIASQMPQRGDIPEPFDFCGAVTIGLFDGIGALRVAAEASQLPLLGRIAVEKNAEARRVTESRYPASLMWEDVTTVDAEVVKGWATHFSQASLIVVGAGPPCQGVSGLNADRKGALKEQLKFHRLRASIPSQCWRWVTVAGWGWRGDPEHINCLELRPF